MTAGMLHVFMVTFDPVCGKSRSDGIRSRSGAMSPIRVRVSQPLAAARAAINAMLLMVQ